MHRSGQDFPDQVVVSLIEMFRNMFYCGDDFVQGGGEGRGAGGGS